MNRHAFLRGTAAALAIAPLAAPSFADALSGTMTQGDLFASLPPGRAGEWTRVILGSGAKYQKQIGLGSERSPAGGERLFFETQVGMPGGSCNPSSMRKAYLRDDRFGSLLHDYAVETNIGRTENMVYRYGEAAGGARSSDTVLRLLDEPWIYDTRPMHVLSATPERIHMASAMHDTTRVVATFSPPRTPKERLRKIELWHSPDFPFGVARYRAEVEGLDAFDLHVYSHGDAFVTMLAMPLDEVRSITKNGAYGQLPAGT